MRIGLLGGLRVESDGRAVPVSGTMQLTVLFRLAVDAGAVVSYRAIAEDIWSLDGPENSRAALQSIVSRLRTQLPQGAIESAPGGYRLAIARTDVDALRFQDVVAEAAKASGAAAARLAGEALQLWAGEPWVPSDDFDWFERDLRRDHAKAVELGGAAAGDGGVAGASAIPVPLTALVGREHELATVAEQLRANRLVTIVGTGGSGKTRLAIEAAAGIPGAILVEFAPIEPSEIWQAILAATGRELRTSDAPAEQSVPRDRAIEALAGRTTTLVLDNCEHILDAAANAAHDLLSSLPRLRILTTSREPLGVAGEAFVTLGSLGHASQAELDSGLAPSELRGYPAVQLLRQRAFAARGSELVDEELRDAAQICLKLDGLPLAIELAAAKLRTMTVAEVLEGLEDRFRLLTGGPRSVLPRHQTLRAMIDWSWSLLDEEERVALARLAVFPAGISAAEAQPAAVSMGLESASVFDRLVDRSLLQRSRGRFRALETVREYGIERLVSSGALDDARRAQAEHLVDRAAKYDRMLRGPGIYDAIAWFDAEDDNLTAALRYCVQAGIGQLATRLDLAMTWYWVIRDRSTDARNWFGAISPLAASVDSDEALLISTLGSVVASAMADQAEERTFEEALASVVEQLAPLTAIDVRAGGNEILQLVRPAVIAITTAVPDNSWNSVTVPRGEDLGLDPWPTALLHLARATIAQNRGDIADQGMASGEAIRMFTVIGDTWGLAISQQFRAEWLSTMGRLDEALEMSDLSTAGMRSITSSADLMQQQQLAVSLFLRRGDLEGARARVASLVEEATASESTRSLAQAYISATMLAVAVNDAPEASRFLALVDGLDLDWNASIPQLVALHELARASVQVLRGELDAAEGSMRAAVRAGIRSQDHPVLAQLALGLGHLLVARGAIGEAARALQLSTVLRGIEDPTELWAIEISTAMRNAGIGPADTEVPASPTAALSELLGE